jgi:hypothetical protein
MLVFAFVFHLPEIIHRKAAVFGPKFLDQECPGRPRSPIAARICASANIEGWIKLNDNARPLALLKFTLLTYKYVDSKSLKIVRFANSVFLEPSQAAPIMNMGCALVTQERRSACSGRRLLA